VTAALEAFARVAYSECQTPNLFFAKVIANG
jgi:hypothetical protein